MFIKKQSYLKDMYRLDHDNEKVSEVANAHGDFKVNDFLTFQEGRETRLGELVEKVGKNSSGTRWKINDPVMGQESTLNAEKANPEYVGKVDDQDEDCMTVIC